MTDPRHNRINRAFSNAQDYDRHAKVQQIVAHALANRIAALDLPPSPRILEIGCGTGFLTQGLLDHGLNGQYLVTDISPAMVARCQQRIGAHPAINFATLDGEYGTPAGEEGFDLICSSLAFQWFDDLPTGVARLVEHLKPGGHCIFTTLAADSFQEWRQAHLAEGLTPGTPAFPSLAQLRAIQPAGVQAICTVATHIDRYDSARDFLHGVKQIGAGTADPCHRPLPPAALRRVMRRFEAAGGSASYQIVTCHYQREATG